jgi:hypothetical protein
MRILSDLVKLSALASAPLLGIVAKLSLEPDPSLLGELAQAQPLVAVSRYRQNSEVDRLEGRERRRKDLLDGGLTSDESVKGRRGAKAGGAPGGVLKVKFGEVRRSQDEGLELVDHRSLGAAMDE